MKTLSERDATRFWSKVDKENGPVHPTLGRCWLWTASVMSKRGGYGQFRVGNTTMKAHRIAFALVNGPLAGGMGALHRCDNPPCCNPGHLFAGTTQDNTADMRSKGRGFDIPAMPGEASPSAKLTASQAADAKRRALAGEPLTELAAEFGITKSGIWRLKEGLSWKNL